MLKIHVDDLEGWDEFRKDIDHLIPSEEQMNRAMSAAAKRVTSWLKAQAVRELSVELGVPKRILMGRFKSFRIHGRARGGKLWLGLKNIPYHRLNPIQDKGGDGVTTRDGNHHETGAFITENKKQRRMVVLKRRGKTWDGKKNGVWQRGPIYTVTLPIIDKTLAWVERAVASPAFEKTFYERLEHELSWRLTQ